MDEYDQEIVPITYEILVVSGRVASKMIEKIVSEMVVF